MVKYEDHSDFCAYLNSIGQLADSHRACMFRKECVAPAEIEWLPDYAY